MEVNGEPGTENRGGEAGTGQLIHRLEIVGDLDRYTAEAVRLEVRRLAKRFEVEIREYRVESAGEGSPP